MSAAQTLLVADDDRVAGELLAEVLGREGYRVRLAAGGEACVRLAESEPFDLALVDLRMPDLDGLMATRAIKEELPRTSILVVTLSEDPDYSLAHLMAEALLRALPPSALDDLPDEPDYPTRTRCWAE